MNEKEKNECSHDWEHIDPENQIAKCKNCGIETKYKYRPTEGDLERISMGWWQ